MKNLYTKPELKISVFGSENVATTASNPNVQQIKDEWKDFASITETRFADLKYVN
ncbi:MAG: hypothetical protein J1G06_03165 [Oscillospiraceae bacterium]|nr:hypothetical protein [Oscillospiraceae bacterium]